MQTSNATFSFLNYRFKEAKLSLGSLHTNKPLNLNFSPSGLYDSKRSIFTLSLLFQANEEDHKETVISIFCEADFGFKKGTRFDEIPKFFFPNSIAIIFPYIRSFISTLTLQANIPPLILPTMNLMPLQQELENHITITSKLDE